MLAWLFQCLQESLAHSLTKAMSDMMISFNLLDSLAYLYFKDSERIVVPDVFELILGVFDNLIQTNFRLSDTSNNEPVTIEFTSNLLDTLRSVLQHLNDNNEKVTLSDKESCLLSAIVKTLIELALNNNGSNTSKLFANQTVIVKCSLAFKEYTLR